MKITFQKKVELTEEEISILNKAQQIAWNLATQGVGLGGDLSDMIDDILEASPFIVEGEDD